jgi:HJR/Mrr/RecB family endonuclease
MARRQKSKDLALFESITGLIGAVAFLYLFVPAFRALVQILFIIGLIILLIGGAAWLLIKFFKNEPSAAFKAIYAETGNAPKPVSRQTTVVEVKPYQPAPEPSLSEKLRKIDWFQFEKLVELIYRHRGYSAMRLGGANPDGGVDLIVSRDGENFLVQCKQWRTWKVKLKDMREFLGVLTDHKVSKGVYITLQGYTEEARQFAAKHGIELFDESDLIHMIEGSGAAYSREVSELFAGKEKCCPKCGEGMVVRPRRADGNLFWGCSTYPRCHYTMSYAAA